MQGACLETTRRAWHGECYIGETHHRCPIFSFEYSFLVQLKEAAFLPPILRVENSSPCRPEKEILFGKGSILLVVFSPWDLGRSFQLQSLGPYIPGENCIAIRCSTCLLMWTEADSQGKAECPPALPWFPSPPGLEKQPPFASFYQAMKIYAQVHIVLLTQCGQIHFSISLWKSFLLPLSCSSPLGIVFPWTRAPRC